MDNNLLIFFVFSEEYYGPKCPSVVYFKVLMKTCPGPVLFHKMSIVHMTQKGFLNHQQFIIHHKFGQSLKFV